MEHSSELVNSHPELNINDEGNYLYQKLWNVCAGPLCNLPKIGEKVYYFPQGYIELVDTYTRENLIDMKPYFNLPSKLRCHVTDIQLKVEKETDEVYSIISLMPDTNQIIIPNPIGDQQQPIMNSCTKILTTSDTTTNGGLFVPIRHAIECLPPLDMSMLIPTQDLIAKDLHGHNWSFKHIYRGTPKRHLITTGWSAFVTAKNLVAGDSIIFINGGNGELRVGIRRANYQQGNTDSLVISAQCMHNGLIVSAMNAFENQSTFVVIYRPRTSQFVVNYDKVTDAMNIKFNIGLRFRMWFEAKDFSKKCYFGTVIGITNFSPHWKDSEWRSLQVQWDELATFLRPNIVSPWEIEPLVHLSNVPQSATLTKRYRLVNNKGSSSHDLWAPTFTIEQEIGQSSMNTPIEKSSMNLTIPTNPKSNDLLDQVVKPMKKKIANDTTRKCVLFGVDIATPSKTKDTMKQVQQYQNSDIIKFSEGKKHSHTQTITSPKGVPSNHLNSTRSFIKVQMQGVPICKVVDLTILHGYNQLKQELEKLFDIKGELQTRNQWEIVFTDHEGDTMLVGDDPWLEFCNMVKKIFIYSKEKFNEMKYGKNFFNVGSPSHLKSDN